MNHPYRTSPAAPAPAPARDDESTREDGILAWLLIAIGALRDLPAVAGGEPFGAEPTLALLAIAAGGVLLSRARRGANARPTRAEP